MSKLKKMIDVKGNSLKKTRQMLGFARYAIGKIWEGFKENPLTCWVLALWPTMFIVLGLGSVGIISESIAAILMLIYLLSPLVLILLILARYSIAEGKRKLCELYKDYNKVENQ